MFSSTAFSVDRHQRGLIQMERSSFWKSNDEIAPSCPRCASTNTKFCYYNNYSLSQPRYFCKACRRYWTKGGSLRNVPVGGGCRKSRRAKPTRPSSNVDPPGTTTMNYGKYNTSPSSSSQLLPSSSPADDVASGNIDLADVFAKFLNQSSDPGNNDSISDHHDQSSSTTTTITTTESSAATNLVSSLDLLMNQDHLSSSDLSLLEVQNHHHDQFINPRTNFQNLSTLEPINDLEYLQSLPSGNINEFMAADHDQDFIILSHDDDSTTTNLQSFDEWQPMDIQMQEYYNYNNGLSSYSSGYDDDHHLITNLPINNNWTSFDPSSFEIFTRP